VMSPLKGNLTIFARYVEARFATQVVLNAELTRFYDRRDWKRRIKQADGKEPFMLFRPTELRIKRPSAPSAQPTSNLPTHPVQPAIAIPKADSIVHNAVSQQQASISSRLPKVAARPHADQVEPQPTLTLTSDLDLAAALTPVDIATLSSTPTSPTPAASSLDVVLRSIDASKPPLQTLTTHPQFETAGELWQRINTGAGPR
jgi:nucleoid DNA-binding protein